MRIITNDFDGQSLQTVLDGVSGSPVRFRAAVAYLTSADFVEKLATAPLNSIHLVVALTPPTNYYALKKIYWRENVHIDVIRAGLHSKLYLVETPEESIAVVGSSNLTSGGLTENIETNVVLTGEEAVQTGAHQYFAQIAGIAEVLTPDLLHAYKAIYDAYTRNNPRQAKVRAAKARKLRSPAAKSFLEFWKRIDHVRSIVEDAAKQRFPELPVYIAIDHFWHYIVSITERSDTEKTLAMHGRDDGLLRLFHRYADWADTGDDELGIDLQPRMRNIQSLLAPSVIQTLTIDGARQVYECLWSTSMGIQRFSRGEKFTTENTLHQIIRTLRALLDDGNEDNPIQVRIDDALFENKLRQFGSSAVQELNGWFNPQKYPIRNDKADAALEILGLWTLKATTATGPQR